MESKLELVATRMQALQETDKSNEATTGAITSDLRRAVMEEEKLLLAEKDFLLSEQRTLGADLSDTVVNVEAIEDAYIFELRLALNMSTSGKNRVPGLKIPRLERKSFGDIVHEYLATRDFGIPPEQRWCNIMGAWLHHAELTCAHIVPWSWNVKALGHMFGTGEESPLTSKRNGLSLQKTLEKAFDSCEIAIVPDGTVEATPTNWKVVVLNPAILNDTFFRDTSEKSEHYLWRYSHIDGRRLHFLNENRPARRYLYLRYTLAWMHAHEKGWAGYQNKFPPGIVWTSPNKSEGYLRKSILLSLGRRIGDKLPKDLLNAGGFDDPDTSSRVTDELSALRVRRNMESHLDGARDPPEESKNDLEGSDSDE